MTSPSRPSTTREAIRRLVRRVRAPFGTHSASSGIPDGVVVVHAPGDAHHVEIGLRPHLDALFAGRPGAWRRAGYDAPLSEVLASAVVVLCRPRFPEAPEIARCCREHGVPSVVMIDDNWLAAGREYPRYAGLFLPGRPDYESFVACVREADATLVYSPVLAEDLRPLAREVEVMPFSFDPAPFAAGRPHGPEAPLTVGYAGSPRFEPSAFEAMASLVEERQGLSLLVMGHEVPPELRSVPAGWLRFEPFRKDVAEYAARLVSLRPTALVAPLDATRFSASKCPLKFFEAAAAGVPGVYSAVPPYAGLVRHGIDGLLAENTVEDWRREIGRLLDDRELRGRVAAAARETLRERFPAAAATKVLARLLARVRAAHGGRR